MLPRPTDIVIDDVKYDFEEYAYRTPIKFGGVVVDRVTLLNVHVAVHTVAGRSAEGFGSMPLGNVWSFPSRVLSYAETLNAMKQLADHVRRLTAEWHDPGHPIEINHRLEPGYQEAAGAVRLAVQLPEPIPKLCTLVVASPFDAAIHDAYGKVHQLSCYQTYSQEYLPGDLSRYLGAEFRGEHLSAYVRTEARARMPLYHLIGALDQIEEGAAAHDPQDGLPNSLPEWIRFNGLTHFKIKLNGDDANWDVGRIVEIDGVVAATQGNRGVDQWWYSLDFNERCANVDYLLDFLRRVRERIPAGFARIQYIEQPTARDLSAHRGNVMHEASKLRPVVIDESLTDLESLQLAKEMGYTGAALKACKGQSQALLMAAAAQKYGMFLCVQDLTCPGASLIHSAGLAAHIPGVTAIEANARQYVPAANLAWESRFPGIFRITDGAMQTGALTGWGLGAVTPAAPGLASRAPTK